MEAKVQIRVRINEIDSLRYLYHGNYASYYNISRTELLRKIGLSDKDLRMYGIFLQVIEMQTKFIKPALYDDLLTVKTSLKKINDCELCFHYEVYNEGDELINVADTIVAYIDMATRTPSVIPKAIKEKLKYLIK